jgi:predicted amidophosphoribosyltransferase
MYCVTCGSLLHSENQVGLVCQPCKRAWEKKRRGKEQPLSISYCFRCGKPYQPRDTSIHHRFCSIQEKQPALSSTSHQENDTIQDARKDTYVLF